MQNFIFSENSLIFLIGAITLKKSEGVDMNTLSTKNYRKSTKNNLKTKSYQKSQMSQKKTEKYEKNSKCKKINLIK